MPYLEDILKPFDFSIWKTEVIAVMAVFTTIISNFSENYLGISGTFALLLFVLLLIDFITGVRVAIKEKIKITSGKGLRTVYKAGGYLLFIFAAYSLYKELEGKAALFEQVIKYVHIYIIVHISFWELFSIDENLKRLGVDLGITDILKTAYNGIKNIFSKTSKGENSDTGVPEGPKEGGTL